MKIIKGERLFLKEIEEHNIDKNVMSWFSNDILMRYYTNSKISITKSILLESIKKGKINGDIFTFGIFDNNSEHLIGTIKLGPINKTHNTSDLVVLLGDSRYRGKGLAVDAIKLGNLLAFKNFGIRKLYGGMYMSNISSIKAYTRADWLVEGRLKGFYLNENKTEDRLLVSCFNSEFFTKEQINEVKLNEKRYIDVNWR